MSLTYKLNAVIKKLYNFDAWWTAWKHEKTVKECFGIQARGPQKREAPGICPVCPVVNPALTTTLVLSSEKEKPKKVAKMREIRQNYAWVMITFF